MGKRVMIYDATEGERNFWLQASWYWGAHLYRIRGQATKTRADDIDVYKGVKSMAELIEFLVSIEGDIDSVQFWGHGWYGYFLINQKWFNRKTLQSSAIWHEIADKFHEKSLWWFRTCSTFGGHRGHAFAEHWRDFFGCKVAGFTHIIGPWQSGLHTLEHDEAKPGWSPREGWKGSGSKPVGITSTPFRPNTIRCTQGVIPAGW